MHPPSPARAPRGTFVSQPLRPLGGDFDTAAMARGKPGLPARFAWGRRTFTVAEVLEQGRDYGDCTHGSGERYLRRHRFRLRTVEGPIFEVYFIRHFGKVWKKRSPRWWIARVEEPREA